MANGIADLTLTGRNGAEASFTLVRDGGIEIAVDGDRECAVVVLGEHSTQRLCALLADRPGRALSTAADFAGRAAEIVGEDGFLWRAVQTGAMQSFIPAAIRLIQAGRPADAVAELAEAEKILDMKVEEIQAVLGRALNAPLSDAELLP